MVNVFDEVSELEFEHATVNNRLRSTQNKARLFAKKKTFLFDFVFMIFPFSSGRGFVASSQDSVVNILKVQVANGLRRVDPVLPIL